MKSFKICNKKLKHIEGKEICPKCFLDLLKRDTITNFDTIMNSFNINAVQMIKIIQKYIDEERIDGIIDQSQRMFYYVSPEVREKILEKIQQEGVITLEKIGTMLDVSTEIAKLLLFRLINKYNLRGRFTVDQKRYYTQKYIMDAIIKRIQSKGRNKISEMANHFDLPNDLVKKFCVDLMRSKTISAYFADRAKEIVTTEKIFNEIKDYAKKYGLFKLNNLADSLKIALELARKMIFKMVNKGELDGFFTQKREFMTVRYFEDKLKGYARAYNSLPLKTVTEKLGITMGTVEEKLAHMIQKGELYGKIDPQKKILLIEDHPPPISHVRDSSALAETSKQVEVLREYDFVGGQLHFKVAVRNHSNMAINNVKVLLDAPGSFKSKDQLVNVPVIESKNTRGVDFYLEPRECGISNIGGTVIFKDASGTQHTIPIQKKEVQIKCPLVCTDMSTIEDCQLAIQSLPNDARAFLIADLDPRLAYRAAIRTLKHFETSVVTSYEEGDVDKDYQAEAWFCAEAKVGGGRIITRIYVSAKNQSLEVRVWCDNPGQLTGFLAKVIELLFEEINIIRKIKSEEREKTIDVMSITQNLAEIADYCSLKWKAQNIRIKLQDTFVRLRKLLGDHNPILDRIEFWLTRLNTYEKDESIKEEDANRLGDDVENFKNVLKRYLTL